MSKVRLMNERLSEFGRDRLRQITSMLPYFQRDGAGYVHRIRNGALHYDNDGNYRHTSVGFWCGQNGFLYSAGDRPRKHAYAQVLTSPSPGRVIFATCEARAIGAGQVGKGKIGGKFVKFKPHVEFFPERRA